MNRLNSRIIPKISFALVILAAITACVESLSPSQQSALPTIQLLDPTSNDSVQIGENAISYQAADGQGGQGLAFYEVYLNGKFLKRYDQSADGNNPQLFLIVDSTLLGSRINYKVKVYNKSGKAKESELQENIYVKDRPPKAPGDLIISRINDLAVNLLWVDSSNNEDGFEVWRKDGGNGIYRKIKTLPANTISTDDGGISIYSDYYYKVRAFNESGYSNFSNEKSTASITGGPWYLKVEATLAESIKLTWNDFAANELGFIIQRLNSTTQKFENYDIAPRNSTTYIDTKIQPSTAYTYRVAYYTSTSVSGYSNEVSVSTYYTNNVTQPDSLDANYIPALRKIEIKWNDNTTLEEETIIERYVGAGSYTEYKKLPKNNNAKNKYDDTNFPASPAFYYYRVRQRLGTNIYTRYSNTDSTEVK